MGQTLAELAAAGARRRALEGDCCKSPQCVQRASCTACLLKTFILQDKAGRGPGILRLQQDLASMDKSGSAQQQKNGVFVAWGLVWRCELNKWGGGGRRGGCVWR